MCASKRHFIHSSIIQWRNSCAFITVTPRTDAVSWPCKLKIEQRQKEKERKAEPFKVWQYFILNAAVMSTAAQSASAGIPYISSSQVTAGGGGGAWMDRGKIWSETKLNESDLYRESKQTRVCRCYGSELYLTNVQLGSVYISYFPYHC